MILYRKQVKHETVLSVLCSGSLRMSRKPETVFTHHVLKRLPESIYVEKMYNPLRGGTYDLYVEGPKNICWIEMKYTLNLPPVLDLTKQTTSPKMSPLQIKWGERATQNGVFNAVILGWGSGRDRFGWIFEDLEFQTPVSRGLLQAHRMSMQQIADWITEAVT